MKEYDIIHLIGGISDEMIENADRMPPRRNYRKVLLIAAVISLCAITLLSVGIMKSGLFRRPDPVVADDIPQTAESDTTAVQTPESDTPASGDQTDAVPVDDIDVTAAPDRTRKSPSSSSPDTTRVPAATAKYSETTAAPAETTALPEPATETEEPKPIETDPIETDPVETDPVDPGPGPEDKLFADVDVSDWSYKYIEYVVENGYMSGITEDTFGPSEDLTRADFVQALYRIAGSPETTGYYAGQVFYHDVEPGSRYYDAILWTKQNRIAVGANVYFSPDSPITRADLAVVLLRFADYMALDPAKTGTAPEFTDYDQIPNYAKNAVSILACAGVISGKDDGRYDPSAEISRAEAAAMLRAIIENSGSRTSALLERYGLDLYVAADLRPGITYRRDQEILVTLTKNGTYDETLPDISVSCSIEGADCEVYGFGAVRVYPEPEESVDDADRLVYYCYVPYPEHNFDRIGGTFFVDEVLKVTLNITVGGEGEKLVVYPSVLYAN